MCQQCHSNDGCLPNDVLFSPTVQLMPPKLRSIRLFRTRVDWQRECFSPGGVTRTCCRLGKRAAVNHSSQKGNHPWIAKAPAGTESPSTKLLRTRRNQIVSREPRALETSKLWMTCLLRVPHTSMRQPFAFFRILMMPRMRRKTACCARFATCINSAEARGSQPGCTASPSTRL